MHDLSVSQDVMREWDADGSGMVGVSELSAAANAYKKARWLNQTCALCCRHDHGGAILIRLTARRFSRRVA